MRAIQLDPIKNYPLMVVSMNCIGSKYKLIAFIQENIHAVVGQPFGCDFLRSVRWDGYRGVCVKWPLGSTLKNFFSLDSVLKANPFDTGIGLSV